MSSATLNKPRVSEQAARVSNWLRFERDKSVPAFAPDIQRATGIKLTPH